MFQSKYTKVGKHIVSKDISHLNPWDKVYVDMIRPKKLIINTFEYQLRAVTCIDDVMNLPEVIPIDNTKSQKLVEVFEDGWLNRYPIPHR